MIGFLAGVATAAVLSLVTLFAMETFYVDTELRYAGPNLNLNEHLINETVGGEDEDSGD